MKVHHRCRWVRDRLPLMAGGELAIDERRRAERHLITCPDCRDRRDASTDALSALRSLAGPSAPRAELPSLWPALADQIRQSRHASPRLSWWDVPPSRTWFAFSLAIGLGVAFLIARPNPAKPSPKAPIVASRPRPAGPVALAPTPRPASSEAPARSLGRLAQQRSIRPIEPPPGIQFNYELDHMTPIDSSNRDPQHSY